MRLFQVNQSEESSKITINVHTTSGQLHPLSITTASTYSNKDYDERKDV